MNEIKEKIASNDQDETIVADGRGVMLFLIIFTEKLGTPKKAITVRKI